MLIFVRLIFIAAIDYENIFITKISRFTVKYEYDQNVHIHFGQQVLDYVIVSSETKGTFALPKMIDD